MRAQSLLVFFSSIAFLLTYFGAIEGRMTFPIMPSEISREGGMVRHSNNSNISYTRQLYSQKINHASIEDNRRFDQVYFTNFDHYRGPGSPIFFYTCGEASIEHYWSQSKFVQDLAATHGAALLYVEHRYYGSSLPFGEKAHVGNNVSHLTVGYALRDFSTVLSEVMDQLGASEGNTSVITFGGSYAGMLAAYMRVMFPWAVTAAVASSAPVLMAGQGYPNPHTAHEDYFRVVTDDYRLSNPLCPHIVRAGYAAIRQLALESKFGVIASTFRLCEKLSTMKDVEHLELYIRQGLLSMAQINYPYERNFGGRENFPANPVQTSCRIMVDIVDSNNEISSTNCSSDLSTTLPEIQTKADLVALRALAAATEVYYAAATSDLCYDMKKLFIFCADQTGCGEGNDALSWDYQVCREFIYFPSTNNNTDMFPRREYTLKEHTTYCQSTWNTLPNPNALKSKFSKEVLLETENIMWTQGTWDPWYYGGVFDKVPRQQIEEAIGAAHHEDLNEINEFDSLDVRDLRKKIDYFVTNMLN